MIVDHVKRLFECLVGFLKGGKNTKQPVPDGEYTKPGMKDDGEKPEALLPPDSDITEPEAKGNEDKLEILDKPVSNTTAGQLNLNLQTPKVTLPESPPKPDSDTIDPKAENSESESIFQQPAPPPHEIGSMRNQRPIKSKSNDIEVSMPQRPEIICRKMRENRQLWEIILSVPETGDIEEIKHNGEKLPPTNGEYRLTSFSGQLSVRYTNGDDEIFPLFVDKPLIFKLSNQWKGNGRLLPKMTRGYFIVVAPQEWERDDPPVAPAGCVARKYTAHYFYRDSVNNDPGGFKGQQIDLTGNVFELNGERVFDDSSEGQLFVGDAPKIKFPTGRVHWLRIGEEKENGWKGINIKISENDDERDLSEDLQNRQGRFFIRVYDDKMLDGIAFRYFRDLQSIQINGEQYSENMLLLPTDTGHAPAKLCFIGRDGENIHPKIGNSPHTRIEAGGTITIERAYGGDKIPCKLTSSDGDIVDTIINLPRVWWRLEMPKTSELRWQDTPLDMTRDEFKHYARRDARISLEVPLKIKSVYVGFDSNMDRSLPNDDILLRYFVDCAQINSPLNQNALLRIKFYNGMFFHVIRVITDKEARRLNKKRITYFR